MVMKVKTTPTKASVSSLKLLPISEDAEVAQFSSPTSVMEEDPSRSWKSLQEKRQSLQAKRVALEEKLFSYQAQESQEPKKKRTFGSSSIKYTLDGKKASFRATDGSAPPKRGEKPNGAGILKFDDQVYTGTIVDGERSGRGRNEWFDTGSNTVYQVYQGEWKNNRRNGRGTHKWMDGRQVTGTWENGLLQGKVYFSWPDGSTYDGEVVNGQKEGRGVQKWNDGKLYNGQYLGGLEHGYGTLIEADGTSTYRGQFIRGKRHGYGLQVWPQKSYDGEWKQNVVSGQGKLTWSSGAVYSGSFRNGQYEGHGSFTNGKSKFIGNWKGGRKEGFGEQTWPSNNKFRNYRGNYVDGHREGFGRMIYADGSMYTGEWVNGQRQGMGVMLNTFGEVIHCGLWRCNEYIRTNATRTTDDYNVSRKVPHRAMKETYTLAPITERSHQNTIRKPLSFSV